MFHRLRMLRIILIHGHYFQFLNIPIPWHICCSVESVYEFSRVLCQNGHKYLYLDWLSYYAGAFTDHKLFKLSRKGPDFSTNIFECQKWLMPGTHECYHRCKNRLCQGASRLRWTSCTLWDSVILVDERTHLEFGITSEPCSVSGRCINIKR